MLTAIGVRAARAQNADPAAAQTLFDQGRAELACAKLEESQRLAPALGTAFNLADCYVHIGRLATAWSMFRDVEVAAQRAGQAERARVARKRADDLQRTLPRLIVQVLEPPPGLEIQRDGKPIGRAQWNTAIPVDLGQHVVTATAPHKKSWRAAAVASWPAETIAVSVPELYDAATVGAEVPPVPAPAPPAPAPPASPPELPAPAVTAPSAPPAPVAATVSPPPPARAPEPARPRAESSGHVAPIALGAAGLGLLVASGVTIAVARSMYDGASPCAGSGCATMQAVAQRNTARNWGNVATVMGVAGVVGVSASAVLWLIAPAKQSAESVAKATAKNSASVATAPRPGWDVVLGADSIQLRGNW
jgi:hypothetical protein